MTATREARRRARTLDSIRTMALDATAAIEGARIADPLTGPRPRHVFDAEAEPIYAQLVAELGVPGQDIDPGPVVVGELATAAIDMTALLTDDAEPELDDAPPTTCIAVRGR
ncbi:hypothetical protein [Mycobacterium sp.]|uniref:hypothetical protein n=1 Tax=Mycobacterium sp. TaxID=1785 RepID=UPI002BD6E963|nr:hypothetical protein [Mycobacterium sp.]HTY35397.1 hypothetical protein [Mycobacterium sp.]